MSIASDWERLGRDWPNRAASRFLRAGGIAWHVQDAGAGPGILLLHGTGAATHSWEGVFPALAGTHRVLAPDLPGHGFTEALPAAERGIAGVSRALGALLAARDFAPEIVVGHSAGAAILARMCLDGLLQPRLLLSLNGALMPLRGMPGQFFAPLARALSGMSLVPRLFAWRARDPDTVDALLDATGSRIGAAQRARYAALLALPRHVAGVLGMMAAWDLRALARDLPRLASPLFLVACERDLTVPPAEAARVRSCLPSAGYRLLKGLGHLGHEEDPVRIAALVEELLSSSAHTTRGSAGA